MYANHHTHTEYCDGKASAAAMAAEASRLGMRVLGFSSHAPLPFRTEWTMDWANLDAYAATIRSLAAEYAPKDMDVLLGLEIDYIDGLCGPADGRFASLGLDFSIGSVHHVRPPALGDDPLATVDGAQEGFDALIAQGYGGDALGLAEDYYRAVGLCVKAGGFDILGHFDLVRKNNPAQTRFREDHRRYRDAAMEAAEALRGTGVIVEINTGGMARGKTRSPYPEQWILRELRAIDVPVCVNSDAHDTAHLSAFREAGVEAARAAGYRELTIVRRGRRETVPLDA